MKIKNKEVGTLERTFSLREANEADRTVEIAFSSEEPYERWFGIEVLDHSTSSVDMSRMQNGAPFLLGHNRDDQIGVIISSRIDDDKVGRATVKFSRSVKGEEIFRDVLDGIRTKISVGYAVNEMVLESTKDGLDTYRVTNWMPFEASLVSIPADDTVGVGRSADEPQIKIEKKEKVMEPIVGTIETIDEAAVRAAAQKEEKARIREISAISNKFKMTEAMKDAAIESGISVAQFREQVLDSIERNQETVKTAIGMKQEDVKRYSLFKAIRAAAHNKWEDAKYELECSQKVAEQLGKDARGFYVPWEIQRAAMGTATAAGITDGGALVGTDHMGNQFIDALRAESVIGRLGARFMTGLVGDVDIPKLTAGATFYWLAEGADVTDSTGTLASVTLSPKTIAGSVPMTRRLLKQSDPSVEAIIRNDLIVGAALAIDTAVIAGTGSANSQPTGIIGTSGVNTVIIADTTDCVPTFPELVQFETAVATDNALRGNLGYLTTPAINGALKSTKTDAGSGIMVNTNGVSNGYPIVGSTLVPSKRVIFGNFNDVIIGMWGVLDVQVDTAALAASGGLVLRVFQDVDVAIRHAESFAIDA